MILQLSFILFPHPSTHTVILGNAYLSLYFTSQQDSKILKQCISAYSQAVCIQMPQFHQYLNSDDVCLFFFTGKGPCGSQQS